MSPLIECVPNISEGRDPATIDAIAAVVRRVAGVRLLHIDTGVTANRTVLTFVGPPAAVAEAAFAVIREAAVRIDMRQQQGAHPRIGATDVCPFVPLTGATMADCVALARAVGSRVGAELGIPTFLYGEAARHAHRRELAAVRAGQFEGLAARMAAPGGAPDFGPAVCSSAGAVAVGARPLLVAFNLNLNTRDRRKAALLAAQLRERGGLLRAVRAIGWYIDEYRRCQISLNLMDYRLTPPHAVLEVARRLAEREGVRVTGAELVGLVPLAALREAGGFYLRRQGLNPGAPDAELVEVAAQSLGLRDVGSFVAEERVLEWRLQQDGPLVAGTVRGMVDAVATASAAPGGGAVAALCGALASALGAMAAQISTGRAGHALDGARLEGLAQEAQALKEGFLRDVDADAAAWRVVVATRRSPEAIRGAVAVPLGVLERAQRALRCLEPVVYGAPVVQPDVRAALAILLACARAAWHSVMANLELIDDDAERSADRLRADAALRLVERRMTVLEDPRMPGPHD